MDIVFSNDLSGAHFNALIIRAVSVVPGGRNNAITRKWDGHSFLSFCDLLNSQLPACQGSGGDSELPEVAMERRFGDLPERVVLLIASSRTL